MGYFNGSKAATFEGGKMRWFPDGRIEIDMDVKTKFPAGPSSRKGLQDLFYNLFQRPPYITAIRQSSKIRGKSRYATNVKWYAKLPAKPSIEILEIMASKAEQALKPLTFIRTTLKSGEVDVFEYKDMNYMTASSIFCKCKATGSYLTDYTKWEIK